MSRRQLLLPVGLALTGLLAVVALAAHGRPLHPELGHGPGATFVDYVVTTVLLLLVVAVGVAVVAVKLRGEPLPQPRLNWWQRALFMMVFIVIAAYGSWALRRALQDVARRQTPAAVPQAGRPQERRRDGTKRPPARGPRIRWDEVAIAAAIAALGAGAIVAARSRRSGTREILFELPAQEQLAAALDDALDDLRAERDPRRAIIAAYARMERALAAAGLPRHRAEAPLEYLKRALLELSASGPAVRRLTDLFEWAKFSHHEPEPRMKDEAIDALVAVRDELRART